MAPSKRKADVVADATASPSKRGRRTSEAGKKNLIVTKTATSSRPKRLSISAANATRSLRSSNSAPSTPSETTRKASKTSMNGSITKSTTKTASPKGRKPVTETISPKGRKTGKQSKKATIPKEEIKAAQNGPREANVSVEIPTTPKSEANVEPEVEENTDGPSYWLMKAEPESRIEKGKDVKFSIDDLKAATSPEGWDGVRNYVARNNMRLMMEGDQAFFYHSNCKVPGIVGTMEIVKEHSVDESAFDPEHPYYDEKSDRTKPKWCVVHVEFRQKFPVIIKLKELQRYAKPGGVLEKMQVLNQARLSVSKVTKKEWDFIMSLVDSEDVAVAAQHQP